MAKILVTGSTGFIGKRLIHNLLELRHEVYAVSRIRGIELHTLDHPNLHIIYTDFRKPLEEFSFPKDIEAAYYLIHSMGTSQGNLLEIEEQTAHNFLQLIEKTECRQIIYLSGIVENEDTLSPHLYSRLAVERLLKKCPIPVTTLRSSIIIGSGSASFEIIRDLVEKLPVMIAPRWVKSICQPIAISDVLFYLCNVLLNPLCYNKTFDIAGPSSYSFEEILLRYADFRKLKRYIFDVPVLTPKISSYWLVFVTSVRFSICQYLVESMKQNTRKLNHEIDTILPRDCLSFEESLDRAFQKIAQNEVMSTWMDSWDLANINADISEFIEVPQNGCLQDMKIVDITIPIEEVKNRLWSLGGANGWYSLNWAWKTRGMLDKFVGGTGFNRGRKHPSNLAVGDSIDFWRVLLASDDKKHLILYAEMKLPGEAWLEFEIDESKNILKQTATFRPKGFFGRIYWYSMLPFHVIIFHNMAKSLAQSPITKKQ